MSLKSISIPDAEDVYELSPLQEGMLFHTIRDVGVGMYINQAVSTMEDVNVEALRGAWQKVLDRHSSLRTSFEWKDHDEPVQIVHKDVVIPFYTYDWREDSSAEQESKLRKFLFDERKQGFDLSVAPLLRISLIRVSDSSWYSIFSQHHIIIDGWSGDLIADEVRKLYDSAAQDKEIALRDPIPFSYYIRWLAEQDISKAELFWKRQLKGVSSPTPLPMDKGPNVKQNLGIESGSWGISIDEETTRQLQLVARKSHVTINTLIFGAWALLLSRYSGEQDVLFGVVVSGRPPSLDGVESIVGMFLNSVPFRVTVSPDMLLKDWLEGLQSQQVELQEFEHSSLLAAQGWSDIPRGTELFGSIISVSASSGSKVSRGSGQSRKKSAQQNYPILIEVNAKNELILDVTFDSSRFDSSAVTRTMEQLRALLESMAKNIDSPLGSLSLLSHDEFNKVVNKWNHTQASYPEDECLHELFEQQVEKTPDAVAVSYSEEQLTYEEFNQQANGLAYYLRSNGIGPGDLVGLCIERSLEMAIGLMAILKAGAAFVPLAPDYPKERLSFMLQNSQAKALLTREELQDHLPSGGIKVICLDKNDGNWKPQKENLENLTTPEHLAYILYTSGSTGTPKGVAVPHRVPVNRFSAEHYPVQPHESIPVKTTLSFVDSLWEMFTAWLHGLNATLIPECHVKDPALLVNDLEACGATRLVFVPSLLRALFESEIDLSKRLPKLKHWISSGETLTADLCEKFSQILPNATLTNLYGTCEVWDASRCDSDERSGGQLIPMGRPIKNLTTYVLDDQFRPQPIGVPGELYVGGEGVALGYLERPEATAERFIPDPFTRDEGKRMYKTGDRVRWLPDGNIEYLGRFDQQVKVRGFRIELGEIENTLSELEGVDQVAVDVRGDNLIAYVVLDTDQGNSLDITQLRDFVSSKLPPHMLPAFYVFLEKFPLTPSGKVDRRALPEPHADNIEASGEKKAFREPETELEKTIASVWSGALKVDSIGLDDNFFELGGHSLSAIRISARLTKTLEKEIPLRGIFEAPTIAELAHWIESGKADQATPELVHVEESNKAIPLTYTQQRLWFLDQLNPGVASYTIPNMMHLNGALKIEALQNAFKDLVERHEVLRTRFVSQDGEPFQVIDPTPDSFAIEVVDLSSMPYDERLKAARSYAREQGRLSWNLAQGPLYRVQLLSLSPNEHFISTALHHIIADGRSMGIFGRELGLLYHEYAYGEPANLPELTIQYSDFAIWEREVANGELYDTHLSYWRKVLEGASPSEIPTDHIRPAVHNFRGEKVIFEVAKPVADELLKLGKQERCTIFMGILAIFQLLLSRYSGQDDVIVGTAMWNRSRVELERLIGLFVNTLPMRVDFSGDPSFREILSRARDCALGAFAHMELPFEEMLKQIHIDRDLSRQGSPLFQTMLIHQPGGGKAEQSSVADGVSMSEQAIDTGFSNFDLLLSTSDCPETGISCMLSYDTDLFDPKTIQRMVVHLQSLFEQVVKKPDEPISHISFLTDSEKQKVLEDWNGGINLPLESRCVHEIVGQWANSGRNKVAVSFEGTQLTYEELDSRANQLAIKLQSMGVVTEQFVGLFVERSIEMIVGALGILKSGGVLVTMDPSYPEDRIKFIIDDLDCSLILTQRNLEEKIATKVERVIYLDEDKADTSDEFDGVLTNNVSPHNLAYVIYTSGSTGIPKGVMVEHRNLTNIVRSQINSFDIDEDSRILQMLSFSFDAAFGEVFRSLVAGSTLFLANKNDLLPGPDLIEILKKNKITAMAISPTALGSLPNVSRELVELRTLTVGGEACPAKVAEIWGEGRNLINGYGPTETTIGATYAKNWVLKNKPPLGTPLENVKAYVLDSNMQLSPIGTPGELYIGGIGVSRGYVHRPDITALHFVPNPFVLEPGERMYRTGDLVRWLSTGELDFLGRIDQQVKIRGHRIELGEIESVLIGNEDIEQSTVVVSDEHGIRRLVAYVTLSGQNKPSASDLREYVKSRLPEYMVPALFMTLHALPMTSNGKVNAKALPRPDFDQLSVKEAYVEPETEMELSLAHVWTTVLGIKKIGLNDNFFELGGDSISSLKVVARLTEAGFNITPKDMFKNQTIAELSKMLGEGGTVIKSEQGLVSGEVPLTPVQRWFFEQQPENPHHFNQWMTIRTPATFDSNVMYNAVTELIDHHDALRMQFKQSDTGSWTQINRESLEHTPFSSVELSTLSDDERKHTINSEFERLQSSLNLEQGPLFQICLFNLGSGQPGRLLIVAHHILVDFVSWPILIEDLMKSYQQLDNGREVRLPPKTTSFKQWAEELEEYSSSAELREEIDFWLGVANHKPEPLVVDFPDGDNSFLTTESISAGLDIVKTRQLLNIVVPHYNTQLSHMLEAVLAISLSRFSGNKQIQIQIEAQGREDIGAEVNLARTIGWFTSFYPASVTLAEGSNLDDDITAAIKQIHAIPNKGIGYSILRYMSNDEKVKGSLSRISESEVAFNFAGKFATQNKNSEPLSDEDKDLWQEMADSKIGFSESKQAMRRNLVGVGAGVKDENMFIKFAYGNKRFRSETIQRLSDLYISTLKELIDYVSKK